MAKRLTEKQKEEITQQFLIGKTIDQLSVQFDCSKLTISRNLKVNLGEKKFKELTDKSKSTKKSINKKRKNTNKILEEKLFSDTDFFEIPPLDYEFENAVQKDLSSVHISEINFPKTAFMLVDKNIELEIKYLRDYPKWDFLSEDDLNRKTIEIFEDIKVAKNFCKKEQKVLKVPNTDVFRIAADALISKGITRIISANKLIAL